MTLARLPPCPAAFTCADWFDGADGYSANGQYVEVLSSFGLPGNISPAVGCRAVDEVVHKLEMMGQKPGTNLADDPRKVRGRVRSCFGGSLRG